MTQWLVRVTRKIAHLVGATTANELKFKRNEKWNKNITQNAILKSSLRSLIQQILIFTRQYLLVNVVSLKTNLKKKNTTRETVNFVRFVKLCKFFFLQAKNSCSRNDNTGSNSGEPRLKNFSCQLTHEIWRGFIHTTSSSTPSSCKVSAARLVLARPLDSEWNVIDHIGIRSNTRH